MGIEAIGGGAISTTSVVNTAPRKNSQVNKEIQVDSVPGVRRQMKAEDITVNQSDKDKNFQSDANAEQEDRGQLNGGKDVDPEKIKSAVDNVNSNVMRKTQCSFKYHEETNRISITVKDSDTDEVIREIPPEKALDMLAKAWELAGLMVDEKR